MKARPRQAFERPAVLFVNRLGDQLMALPAMRALATIFPDRLQLLLGEDMRRFFYRGLRFAEPVCVRWAGSDERIDVERTAREAAPCDLLISLSGDPLSFVAPLAERLGASWTIGYGEGLDERLPYRDRAHAIDTLFAIPQCLDPALRLEEFWQPPTFSPAAEQAATRFLGSARGPFPRALFVHPETCPERLWASDRLAWVIERFLAERPDFMVLVASLDPVDLGSDGRRVRWIDRHLELTLALMRYVDLFLGVDSCFLHAADLYRIPGVALFGPTPAWQKGFRFSTRTRHVSAPSMDGIGREAVLEALLDVASAVPASPGVCHPR
jgi:ADP-heptose:LPS heptosyltransferase